MILRVWEVALGVRRKIADKTPTHGAGVRLPKLRVKPNTKAMRIQIPLISRPGEGGVKWTGADKNNAAGK